MKIPKATFIVVPCYNEKAVLRQTLLQLVKKEWNVILVDDCSTEDIWSEVQDLPIFYLKHLTNLGQGAALQTGMDFALQKNAEIVVHFDADGQHDANEIEKLIQPIVEENFDVVLGSRFLQKNTAERVPRSKQFLLKIARSLNGMLTGLWLSDAHNGFRAMNQKALNNIRLTENRMAHATEILSLIKRNNLRVKEVPVHISYSEYSMEKGQSLWNSINILFDLLKKRLL